MIIFDFIAENVQDLSSLNIMKTKKKDIYILCKIVYVRYRKFFFVQTGVWPGSEQGVLTQFWYRSFDPVQTQEFWTNADPGVLTQLTREFWPSSDPGVWPSSDTWVLAQS